MTHETKFRNRNTRSTFKENARPSFPSSSLLLWGVLVLVSLLGCKEPTTQTVEKSTEAATTAGESDSLSIREGVVSEAQRNKALEAKDVLFAQLSGRLMEVMQEAGPAAAIDVCSKEAASIAAAVGKEQGVAIGRTSFRLRNKTNRPPAWARSLVQQRAGEPKFVSLPDGKAGALLPIRLQEKCLMCHGAKDTLLPDVGARLAATYPHDQATGFKVGDLRGWFWVEVPPSSTSDGPSTNDATRFGQTKAVFVQTQTQGRGRGGPGRGQGRGQGMMGNREDMVTLHAMFADRDKIKRTVKMLATGAEATTESDDSAIASLLQEHVPAMESRVVENNPLPPMTFHPIFVELIKHSEDYELDYEATESGMKVTYSAEDPFVIMLVQEHAKLVSRFIKNGMSEIHKPYTLPQLTSATTATANQSGLNSESPRYRYPKIPKFGKIVQLPDAAQQPRDGSRIVVDITKGGDPKELNSALEKVCRFVNIYAGAGKNSAKVIIAVVLHGDATLVALNDEAYKTKFGGDGNPSAECLQVLKEAGVELFVCGQSLMGKGAKPAEVRKEVAVAVSALTSLANLQSDGYAYLPMLK